MPEVVVPLTIRDLTAEDLPSCAWLGSASYLASVARALERARRGETDYLAVCPPSGLPVALGGVDCTRTPGAGRLQHLEVRAALRSCGIGTLLIQAAEQRIRARSWDTEGAAGFRTRYETVCTLMRKQLP
jgi:GNAT superfamily N-acetyltransferase